MRATVTAMMKVTFVLSPGEVADVIGPATDEQIAEYFRTTAEYEMRAGYREMQIHVSFEDAGRSFGDAVRDEGRRLWGIDSHGGEA